MFAAHQAYKITPSPLIDQIFSSVDRDDLKADGYFDVNTKNMEQFYYATKQVFSSINEIILTCWRILAYQIRIDEKISLVMTNGVSIWHVILGLTVKC